MSYQINRVYIPYWDWEDFNNGMWNGSTMNEDEIKKAIDFTSNHIEYGKAMRAVVEKWPNTMLHNLTNKSINRKAFLGHCACCYKEGLSEDVVRHAWKLLTETQRSLANLEAENTIIEWEKKYITKLMNTSELGKIDVIQEGFQMKFQM